MRRYFFIITGFLALTTSIDKTYASDSTFQPVAVFSRYEDSLDIKADSTSVSNTYRCLRINRPQDIQKFSKRSLYFSQGIETSEVLEAYTLTHDGRRLDVNPKHIRRQDANNSVDGFTDTQVINIVFPDVAIGSQICWHAVRIIHKPIFPGFFSNQTLFSPDTVYEQANIRVSAPDHYQVHARGIDGGLVRRENARQHYQFRFAQLQARMERSELEAIDYAPGLFIASHKDYGEMAELIWQDYKTATIPSAAISALAQDLTSGIKSPRDQARELYEWINRNIRYTDISLDRGGWVPTSADEVLRNKHGDCKGMAVLLSALLTSVGIDSTPALIDTGEVYQVPPVPVSYFNHVITYIPSLDLFLDATAKQTPFAVLDAYNQGKPALLLATSEIKYTPYERANQAQQNTTVFMTIQADGRLIGETEYRPTGRHESSSRSAHFDFKKESSAHHVDQVLARSHETGTGQINTPDPDDLNTEWVVRAKFALDPVANIPGPGALRIPVGVAPGVLYQMAIARYDPAPPGRPIPCSTQRTTETYHIDFPMSVRITRLPPDVTEQDGLVSYQSRYRFDAKHNRVTAERQYVLETTSRLCTAGDYLSKLRIHKALQRDMRQQIFYE